jgi:hypothetical protein
MPTWRTRQLPANTSWSEGAVLLNDGRLLLVGNTGSQTLTPDSRGDYFNGSLGAFAPFPIAGQTSFGGSVALMPDGRVIKWGSHQQQDAPHHDRSIVYDPETNTWRNSARDIRIQHSCGSIVRLVDGRVGKVFDGSLFVVNPDTDALVVTSLPMTTAYANWAAGNGPGIPHGMGESSWVQIPGNRYVCLGAGAISPMFLNTNQVFILTEDVRLDIDLHPLPSYPTASWYTGLMNGGADSSNANPYVSNASINWTMLSGINNGYGREVPAFIWVPKFQRVMALGGGLGEMWSYDPVARSTSIVAQAPQQPVGGGSYFVSHQLEPSCRGLTVDQLLSRARIEFRSLGSSMAPSRMWFTLNNGMTVKIEPTSVTRNGGQSASGIILTSDIIEFNGPFRQGHGPARNVDTTSVTVADAYDGPPHRMSAEASAAVLPNGNFLVSYDQSNGAAFNGNSTGEWLEWDGSQFITHRDDFIGNVDSWTMWIFMLPTGELLGCTRNGRMYFRSDTMTQYEPQRPIVDSLPTAARPGSRFTLRGRQLWGLHVGTVQGDDMELISNNPVVQITNPTTGEVRHLKVITYGSSSITPLAPSELLVEVPANTPAASYQLRVISAGNPSHPVPFAVHPSGASGGASGFFNPF